MAQAVMRRDLAVCRETAEQKPHQTEDLQVTTDQPSLVKNNAPKTTVDTIEAGPKSAENVTDEQSMDIDQSQEAPSTTTAEFQPQPAAETSPDLLANLDRELSAQQAQPPKGSGNKTNSPQPLSTTQAPPPPDPLDTEPFDTDPNGPSNQPPNDLDSLFGSATSTTDPTTFPSPTSQSNPFTSIANSTTNEDPNAAPEDEDATDFDFAAFTNTTTTSTAPDFSSSGANNNNTITAAASAPNSNTNSDNGALSAPIPGLQEYATNDDLGAAQTQTTERQDQDQGAETFDFTTTEDENDNINAADLDFDNLFGDPDGNGGGGGGFGNDGNGGDGGGGGFEDMLDFAEFEVGNGGGNGGGDLDFDFNFG